MPGCVDLGELRALWIASPRPHGFTTGQAYREAQRRALAEIPVQPRPESAEPLVNCFALGLLGQDYYHRLARGKAIVDERQRVAAIKATTASVWLRQSIALDLKRVDEAIAPHGLRLYLLSGYRSPELQAMIINVAAAEQGREFSDRMLASVEVHLPHATGAAFDIELWSDTEQRLLPTKIPGHFERDYLESRASLSPAESEIRDNRRLVHNLLTTDAILAADQVFIPHPTEYWHYGRQEKMSVFFARMYGLAHEAIYPEISHFAEDGAR